MIKNSNIYSNILKTLILIMKFIIVYTYGFYECLPRIDSSVPNGSAIDESPASEVLIVFKAPIWATALTLLN